MTNISWTDPVKNEKIPRGVNEERNILHTIKSRKANWTGHILRKNCILKHWRKEGKRRQVTRRKHLLGYLKEGRGYWKLKQTTRSHFLENSLWKRLLTFRKADYVMTKIIIGVAWEGARGANAPPQYFFSLRIVFWLLNWIMANKK
jgi:hypothetical protein